MSYNTVNPSHLPLDIEQFNAITEGKSTHQEELLKIFFYNAEECIVVMEHNCSGDTCTKWQDASEELKNISSNIGALELYKVCAIAEKIVSASEYEKKKMLASIKLHTQRLRAFVRNTRY